LVDDDPSLNDVAVTASASATSREWVLVPVLKQVLPEMVDGVVGD